MKLIQSVAVAQSIYTLATALWPIIDIRSFMEVTGYKTDIWLVKTVAVLLLTNGLVIGSFAFQREKNFKTITLLGFLTAISLFSIDAYYTSLQVIPDIYLADAVIEVIIAAMWMYGYWKYRMSPG